MRFSSGLCFFLPRGSAKIDLTLAVRPPSIIEATTEIDVSTDIRRIPASATAIVRVLHVHDNKPARDAPLWSAEVMGCLPCFTSIKARRCLSHLAYLA